MTFATSSFPPSPSRKFTYISRAFPKTPKNMKEHLWITQKIRHSPELVSTLAGLEPTPPKGIDF